MPRHSFTFPPDVRNAVRRYVSRAVASVDPRRYNQEPAYSAALARALEGTAYEGPHGLVKFQSTVVNERGRGAAQKWSGVDLAITADVSDRKTHVQKAIIVQAKKGSLSDLSNAEARRLRRQIEDMRQLTKHPKVMDIPRRGSKADPGMYSGFVYNARGKPKRYSLADYFVQRVLTTLDGDTRQRFVHGVQDSRLTTLRVIAEKKF